EKGVRAHQNSKLFFTQFFGFRRIAQKQRLLLFVLYKNVWKMKKTLAKNLQICYAGIWRSRVQESTGMAS
ncbi:MAG: hypothetical protein ACLUOF_10305, partial [Ruminococcus sp.]